MKTYKDIATDGGSDVLGQVTEQANRLQERMASVKHVVAVMSGKGGVGKSSVAVNLASVLALDGQAVGIVDADVNGPSVAKMTGVREQILQTTTHGVAPAVSAGGLRVMSIDLFLPDDRTPVVWEAPTQKDAYTWRSMMEVAAVREFLADTAWGELDALVIDLPPGTDKLPNLVDVLPQLSGTIVVTIPSEVSQLVVGKSIRMAERLLQTPVIGLVENMSSYVCTHCGEEERLFPEGHTKRLADEYEIPLLGRIPFDPRMAVAADEGVPFMERYPETPAGRALRSVAEQMQQFLMQQTPMQA